MSTLNDQLNNLLREPITHLGYEYVGCEFIPLIPAILRVYIDKISGINVADCARASRQISAILDVADPIDRYYLLEVSSPGADRPLFNAAQYVSFIGREVILQFRTAVHNQRKLVGIIKAVEGEEITISVDGSEETFNLSAIRKANIVPHS